jgi:ribonuclease HI
MGLSEIIEEALGVDRAGSSILEHLLLLQSNSFPGLISVNLKETISVTCWYLWWLRRRRTHDEEVPPTHRCRMSILGITTNAAKATKPALGGEAKWKRPEPRHVKLNVDAAFDVDSRSGAVGAILRDYKGDFIAASSCVLPYVSSVAAAEATAMKEGLQLACTMGCNRISAESDSKETVDACSGETRWWSESAAIFADCVDLAASIGTVEYIHCPREAN